MIVTWKSNGQSIEKFIESIIGDKVFLSVKSITPLVYKDITKRPPDKENGTEYTERTLVEALIVIE